MNFNSKAMSIFYFAFIVNLAIILGACSGGETGTGQQPKEQIVSVGSITAFGSVYVNGVQFDTDDTTFTINGVNGTEDQLAHGMVVTVKGGLYDDDETGIAESIIYKSELEGIVTTIDHQNKSFAVLWQTVIYGADTIFNIDGDFSITNIADIQPNSVVEINGYRTQNNEVYATRIVLKNIFHEEEEIKVAGVISAYAEAVESIQFTLGNINIKVDAALTELDNIPNDQLADNMSVIVVLNVDGIDIANPSQVLTAITIKLNENEHDYEDLAVDEKLELEGISSATVDLAQNEVDFNLNGILVRKNSNTALEGVRTTVAINDKLKVKGQYTTEVNSQTVVLLAEKIIVKEKGDSSLEGVLQSVNVEQATIILGGLTFHINNDTVIKDEVSINPIRRLSLLDLSNSSLMHTLEVIYYATANTNVATSVIRKEVN